MKSLKQLKIIHKFLLFVLPLAILSIVVTSVVLSWTSYNYFQKTINQDYRNIIKSSAGEIRLFIENAQKALESLAAVMAATKLDPWQKEIALAAFNRQMDKFMSVSLIAAQGKIIASTRWENDVDFAGIQKELFERALAGQNAASGVVLTKENLPYIHMAVPVSHLGEVVEVLWSRLNLKSVWDILEGITIGRSGQVYIMDLSGRYIAHREIHRVVTTPPAEKPDIFKAVKASDMPVSWMEKKDGTRFFFMGYYIPGLEWVIVLQQPLSEIYTYLYRNIFWAIALTAVICLTTLFIGWNRVKRFLAPIHTLHRQVQNISRGDLEQNVAVDSRDEIGDLGLAFNAMTDSLKEYVRREVEAAKELVHAKNLAVLGTTSSKVTHEVGNLLNNIGTALAVLQGETIGPKGAGTLAILAQESDRVKTFIHNFLQFAKKPDLHLQQTALDSVIKEALVNYQPEADKKGVRLELDWPPETPWVNIDPGLMYQVVNNLVKNSLDAMTGAGVISIKGNIEGEHLRLAVKDTGSGISPDTLEKIFDPFFTTKGSAGTGLGMAIVKTIVEAHRGTIECQSELNKGTTVIMCLPLR